jgi:hypothetical protein
MPRDEAQIFDNRPLKDRDIVLWSPEKIGGQHPVKWNRSTPGLIRNFEETLESANDEKPLQAFFEKNPQALLTGIVSPHIGWVIPRPKLQEPDGGFWQPDFIVCDWTSVGPEWFIIELESPMEGPLIKNGDTSRICNHAMNQIGDYRNALEEHGHFIRGDGWPKLHGKFRGVVVIGRRSDPLREKYSNRLRQYRNNDIEIMSYDRLFDTCKTFQNMMDIRDAQTPTLLSERPNPD